MKEKVYYIIYVTLHMLGGIYHFQIMFLNLAECSKIYSTKILFVDASVIPTIVPDIW